jgi:nucleotide-binding universal stress UspA family protein
MVPRPYDGETPSFPAIRQILVALDGSEFAESALAPAAGLARATGARLTLVRVVPLASDQGPFVVPFVQRDLIRARTYLADVAAELRDEGLDVAVWAELGHATALTIAELADASHADVIALASHGGGASRAGCSTPRPDPSSSCGPPSSLESQRRAGRRLAQAQ